MALPTDELVTDWASDANFSSGPESGNATQIDPTTNAPQGFVPGDPYPSQWANYVLANFGAWIEYLLTDVNGTYGDASDGNVTIASGTTTLSRDMNYDTLTINVGATLDANGYRVFARTLVNNGTISNNGVAGGAPTAGTGAPNGSVGAGTDGGAGGVSASGTPGTANTDALGGAGGSSGSGIGTARAGGSVTAPTAAGAGGVNHPPGHLGYSFGQSGGNLNGVLHNGGAGGGGGDGIGATGGGGGGGGGVLCVIARQLTNTGTISANGGDGGAATGGGDGDGGGGGGGGRVIIVTRELADTGTIEAAGGAGGAGTGGSGGAGVAGSAGTVITMLL